VAPSVTFTTSGAVWTPARTVCESPDDLESERVVPGVVESLTLHAATAALSALAATIAKRGVLPRRARAWRSAIVLRCIERLLLKVEMIKGSES